MRSLFLLTGLLIVTACQTSTQETDDVYQKNIIGTWSWGYPEKDGISLYGEKTYNTDGTATGFIIVRSLGADEKAHDISRTTFQSQWIIEDGILHSYNILYSDGKFVDLISDKIISILNDRAEYKAVASGNRFSRERIK